MVFKLIIASLLIIIKDVTVTVCHMTQALNKFCILAIKLLNLNSLGSHVWHWYRTFLKQNTGRPITLALGQLHCSKGMRSGAYCLVQNHLGCQ